jgi:DNA-binding transcriptional ArsR family regulator
VDAFEALADPVRRQLMAEVAIRPMRVVDLAAGQPISRPAVSKHLRLLSEAGLLEVSAHGRERHYTLRREPLGQIHEFVDQLMQVTPRVTDQMLDALDTEVHRTTRDRRQAGRRPSHQSRTPQAPVKEVTA